MTCTAATDKNAYNEEKTGKKVGHGAYTKCYPNSEDLIWKCVLCIYQGNFAKDTTGAGGKYFLLDKTCAYAEKFKGQFCG